MATDVYFSNNAADWGRLPGLYIAEQDPPGFVSGVDLSAVGILGVTVRGPTTVQTITSVSRFVEIYGGRDYGSGGTLINKIWKDIINKPFGTLYIKRVAASDAVAGAKAFAAASATTAITVTATSVGAWSTSANGGPKITIASATNGLATHYDLTVSINGKATTYQNVPTSSTDDAMEVIGDDPATLISVTQNVASLLPSVAASIALSSGSDGTLASSDFTAALTELANTQGPRTVFCADVATSQANLNAQIVTDAATVADKVFVTWSGTHGLTPAAEVASLAAHITTRSDRIIWCYNSPYTIDPDTSLQIQTSPASWMASIFSQNDVDIHPGSQQASSQLAGIRKLTNQSLNRADLITLKEAGICTLEQLPEGFQFRDGVTTSLTSGKTEITRRRMTDFIQLSLANRLRYYVKRKNTAANRAGIRGDIEAFLTTLANQERIVDTLSSGAAAFNLDQDSVNTAVTRAQGIEQILIEVKLVSHILSLVLLTNIGTAVSITEQ